jgi:hypothetical protein
MSALLRLILPLLTSIGKAPAHTSKHRSCLSRNTLAINFPSNTEQICSTPNVGGSATPVNLSPADRTRSNNDYDHWAQSLSAYEHSLSVSPFTSKFDAFLKGIATLTSDDRLQSAGQRLGPFKGWITGPAETKQSVEALVWPAVTTPPVPPTHVPTR